MDTYKSFCRGSFSDDYTLARHSDIGKGFPDDDEYFSVLGYSAARSYGSPETDELKIWQKGSSFVCHLFVNNVMSSYIQIEEDLSLLMLLKDFAPFFQAVEANERLNVIEDYFEKVCDRL